MVGETKTNLQRATRRRRPASRRRRGVETLEAALVFPLLLALAFGTVEFGYYFYVEHNLESAAREGARRGVVPNATDDEIIAAIDEVMSRSGYTTNDYDPPTIVRDSEFVEVEIVMHWNDVNPGLRPLQMIQRDEVKGIATMRREDIN